MVATANTSTNTQQLASISRFHYDVSLKNATSLRLKTQEGDIVTLSRTQSLSFSESSEQSQSDNGGTVQTAADRPHFSASGQAAAQYSMSVQGDLNDEEKAAIDELTKKIDPIAQNFFDDVTSNPDELDQALKDSLGTLSEVNVNFEQTTTLNYTAEQYGQVSAEHGHGPKGQPVDAPAPQAESDSLVNPENASIRDVAALVKAVVDAVLHPHEVRIPPRDERILQSFDDLRKLLNSKLKEFFSQLSKPADLPPDRLGKPGESGDTSAQTKESANGDAQPQPEPQSAPQPQSRFQPVTV